MNSVDSTLWHLETPTTQQVIATYCPLSKTPNLSKLTQAVHDAVDAIPRLKERVNNKSIPEWEVDPEFSIENHLQYVVDSSLGNMDDVRIRAEKLYSEPIDKSHPLWKLVVITNRSPGDSVSPLKECAACIMLFHHSFADGLGCFSVFREIAKTKDERFEKALTKGLKQKKEKNFFKRIIENFLTVRKLVLEFLISPGKSPLNGINSSERFLETVELPWEELQAMRRGTSYSVNDLLLGIVSGALRRYHLAYNAPLNALRVIMPVSLRRLETAKKLGNQLSATGVTIPLEPENALLRLSGINRGVRALKDGGGLAAYSLVGAINRLLPPRLVRVISEAHARRTNLICTNMSGPREPEYMADAQVLGHYGMAALMRGHGISVSFVSYCQSLCIGIVGDKNIVKAPELLPKYFYESFIELQELLNHGGADTDFQKRDCLV